MCHNYCYVYCLNQGGVSQNLSSVTNGSFCYKLLKSLLLIGYQQICHSFLSFVIGIRLCETGPRCDIMLMIPWYLINKYALLKLFMPVSVFQQNVKMDIIFSPCICGLICVLIRPCVMICEEVCVCVCVWRAGDIGGCARASVGDTCGVCGPSYE